MNKLNKFLYTISITSLLVLVLLYITTNIYLTINNHGQYHNPRKGTQIIFFSDPHIGHYRWQVYWNPFKEWIIEYNPDHIFSLGDNTDSGFPSELDLMVWEYRDIAKQTNTEKIWVTSGNHDRRHNLQGLAGAEELYKNYVVEIGNLAFININWINTSDCVTIPHADIGWLNQTLQHYKETTYNIFIYTHHPLHHTNIASHGWNLANCNASIATSKKMLKLFRENRVDVYLSGHVHLDADDYVSTHPEVMSGNVVSGSIHPSTMAENTTYIHVPVICSPHGKTINNETANYPEAYYADFVEGEGGFDLYAIKIKGYKVFTVYDIGITYVGPENVNISYNNTNKTREHIRIPLSYPIQLK